MAKNKFKKILKWTGIGLVLAVIGVGVYHGIKHQDKLKEGWNNFWGIENSAPKDETQNPGDNIGGDENQTPDDNPGGEENPLTFEVKFKSDDGEISTQNVSVGGYSTLPEEPTKEGYNFLGYALEGTTEIVDPLTYPITENTVFVAVFEEAIIYESDISLFTITDNTITEYLGNAENVRIPASYLSKEGNEISITTIGHSAFKDKSNLKRIDFSDNITTISTLAFENTGITSLKVPANLTEIDNTSFDGCDLESIIVDENNTIFDSRENCNAIIEKSTNKLVKGCKNTVIPNSVNIIGGSAFRKCFNLTNITIPDSVTEIGMSAFVECTKLTSITIPNSVTKLSNGAFYVCSSLKNVSLPSNLISIGSNAFGSCESLETITIPASVTKIDMVAFMDCTNLKTLIMLGTTPPTIAMMSLGDSTELVIYVPDDAVDTYKSNWTDYSSQIKGISELDDSTFGDDNFTEDDNGEW